MKTEELVNIVTACMKHSEKRLARLAAHEATERVVEYLMQIGVLDKDGHPKPNQRLKVRVVDSACYPPLWVQ